MMFVVGLTGGIGSGKTKVADEFARLGAGMVDADVIAREVVAPESLGLAKITAHFGSDILLGDGQLNRAKLRQRIFAHEPDRIWLNTVLHPLIRAEMHQQCLAQTSTYTVLVVPLLIENQLQPLCQRILTVDVPVSVQVQRTCARDGISNEQAMAIIQRQASRWRRLRAAQDILNNHQPWSLTAKEVLHLHQLYLEFGSLA